MTQKGNSAEVTFKGKDGQEARMGEGVALPEGFPKDVAIYPKATIFVASKDKQGAMTVVLKVADATQQVTTFYKEKLKENGWEIENEMNMGTTMMLQGAKEGRKLVVSINKDSEQTVVSLMLKKEN